MKFVVSFLLFLFVVEIACSGNPETDHGPRHPPVVPRRKMRFMPGYYSPKPTESADPPDYDQWFANVTMPKATQTPIQKLTTTTLKPILQNQNVTKAPAQKPQNRRASFNQTKKHTIHRGYIHG